MKSISEFSDYLRTRVVDLYRAKNEGEKIVGFLPGDFVPEELIHASGAIPICLVHGGTAEPVVAASYAASRFLCPFSKAAIGQWTLEQPYYRLIDFLVAPISCNHLRRAADMWFHFSDKEVFYLGIPHEHAADHALAYYLDSVLALKQKLEDWTGNKITDDKLKESIKLYNSIRSCLKNISDLRKEAAPPLKGSEFISLNHASYYSDPVVTLKVLQSFYEKAAKRGGKEGRSKARLLLTGPNIAMGDTKLVSIIENLGGEIVIEEICEGIRFYWENISTEGDLLRNIGEKYLTKRVPCAFQGQGTKERVEFLDKLAREYKVDGVVWYELRYCETYNLEYHHINQHFEKIGVPIIKIESEYDPSDFGQINTRMDAFIEILERRNKHV
jgi:benzoyl-CoA reductase/2-hydroxyglutaryl-CoA dehydratase subunit BcrC/BadD/HgdB